MQDEGLLRFHCAVSLGTIDALQLANVAIERPHLSIERDRLYYLNRPNTPGVYSLRCDQYVATAVIGQEGIHKVCTRCAKNIGMHVFQKVQHYLCRAQVIDLYNVDPGCCKMERRVVRSIAVVEALLLFRLFVASQG